MRKKILKFSIIFLFTLLLASPTIAQVDPLGMQIIDKSDILLSSEDPRNITVRIINVVLTLLGIIALIIVLLAGFKWMTSGGNQEEVGQAKKLLTAGLIGLIIILTAWGITTFIITEIGEATIPQY